MKIISLQISTAQIIPTENSGEWWDKEWLTSFYKEPVEDKVWLAYEGLEGDGSADRENHGGVDKALCVYSYEHYDYWSKIIDDLTLGAFGENLTVSGLLEDDICLGDVYQIGDAIVQVSQPREPCWKLARRWKIKDLTKQVEDNGRTGFYFRVLKNGYLHKDQLFTLIKKGHEEWTITRCNEVMKHPKLDLKATAKLAICPELSGSWKDSLSRKLRNT